jgi:C-terminal processing protease CtpA/Prc
MIITQKIEFAYKTLDTDYYKKQNSSKLSEAAINGMVKAFNSFTIPLIAASESLLEFCFL